MQTCSFASCVLLCSKCGLVLFGAALSFCKWRFVIRLVQSGHLSSADVIRVWLSHIKEPSDITTVSRARCSWYGFDVNAWGFWRLHMLQRYSLIKLRTHKVTPFIKWVSECFLSQCYVSACDVSLQCYKLEIISCCWLRRYMYTMRCQKRCDNSCKNVWCCVLLTLIAPGTALRCAHWQVAITRATISWVVIAVNRTEGSYL